jgi:hypothetical protein
MIVAKISIKNIRSIREDNRQVITSIMSSTQKKDESL